MSEPTEEQIKELWEWCGCVQAQGKLRRDFHYESGQKVGDWRFPDGSMARHGLLPPIDLKSLFKWAVPKLRDKNIAWELRNCVLKIRGEYQDFAMAKLMWNKKAFWKFTNLKLSIKVDRDPAQALFWAIYKVIKEQK